VENKIKVGSVQSVIDIIGKTIKLAGSASPLHCPGTTSYLAVLTLQMVTYHQNDLATDKQVVVPVYIPDFIFLNTRNMDNH